MNSVVEPHTITLIGAGRMGRGIGRNLLRHGVKLRAFDPDANAMAAMAELGATAAASVADAARGAAILLTCLPDVATVRAVYLGPGGLLAHAPGGSLIADMTSSSPALTRELAAQAAARGIAMVDAPILKGVPEAWEGTSHFLLGGTPESRARCLPVLKLASERVIETGGIGTAHALKAINNAVSMSNAVVLGETLQTARRLGFDPQMVIDVLRGGLANSRMLELYAPRFVSGEHPRTGSIAFGEKDIGAFLEVAREAGAMTPTTEAAHLVYGIMCGIGMGAEAPSRLADLLSEFSDRAAGRDKGRPHT